MVRILALIGCCHLAVAVIAAAHDEPEPPSPYIDLRPKANLKLKDDFGTTRFRGNNLSALPIGLNAYAGVKFRIGDRLIHLGNDEMKTLPKKAEGMKVGRTVTQLHFMHGTGYSVESGMVIAKYIVHYADKTKSEVDVTYGKDVVDWWAIPNQVPPTDGKLAWEGENEPVKEFEAKIRLYAMSWKNPHPKKKVVSIDFVATATETRILPFCVAITAEK